MELRSVIEPKIEVAEELYSKILDLILKYTEFLDNNGDENNIEYQKVAKQLNLLTNKDISNYNLSEYWEEEGAEVLAFRIGLPYPIKVENVTQEETIEIIRRISDFEQPNKGWDELTFSEQFSLYLDDYYHTFLKLNFKKYDYKKIFGHQKSPDKKQFWLTNEEKASLLFL